MTNLGVLVVNAQNSDLGTTHLLLDSSLIIATKLKKYNYKVVCCGDYFQVYYYPNSNVRNAISKLDINGLKKEKDLILNQSFSLEKVEKTEVFNNSVKEISNLDFKDVKPQKILDKNILRTKLEVQRLAKTNAKYWTSFITLTYEENFTDISLSKKHLHNLVRQITRIKPDFRYLCVIEFQKRGAIHYHMLTNLTTQDNNIIVPQENNKKFYDLKQWKHGFSSFEDVGGDIRKIVGYISKYMTKECDDRLFSVRRYSYSRNLDKPIVNYIDTTDIKHLEFFNQLLKGKTAIYSNTYLDKNEDMVYFEEFQTL